MRLTIRWPERVSALTPVSFEAELVPPPGVESDATVAATVTDPEGEIFWSSELVPRAQGAVAYVAEAPLRLPLEPMMGYWRVEVDVQSRLKVEGKRRLIFRPHPISFLDLEDGWPDGFDMRVPEAFVEVVAEGDPVAGRRVWQYDEGALELWWAPGPAEPLLLNNAIVMLEATHNPNVPPDVHDVEETTLQEQPAFLFHEEWPGETGGPAKSLVIQGPDRWLYVLRVRAVGSEEIPSLLYQVWKTFTFVE